MGFNSAFKGLTGHLPGTPDATAHCTISVNESRPSDLSLSLISTYHRTTSDMAQWLPDVRSVLLLKNPTFWPRSASALYMLLRTNRLFPHTSFNVRNAQLVRYELHLKIQFMFIVVAE